MPCTTLLLRPLGRLPRLRLGRGVATLAASPHVYIHPPQSTSTANEPTKEYTLSLLATPPTPVTPVLGTTPHPDPTTAPSSFALHPAFLPLVQRVLAAHAAHDPAVQAQASAFASQARAFGGGVGVFRGAESKVGSASRRKDFKHEATRRDAGRKDTGQTDAGKKEGGSKQETKGGWVHVADARNPPDWGRIAYPEDIFGSVEVDGAGQCVEGAYQVSGTYRVVTREGVLGLSEYLLARVRDEVLRVEAAGGTIK